MQEDAHCFADCKPTSKASRWYVDDLHEVIISGIAPMVRTEGPWSGF